MLYKFGVKFPQFSAFPDYALRKVGLNYIGPNAKVSVEKKGKKNCIKELLV